MSELELFRRRLNLAKANAEGFRDISAGPTRCSGQFMVDSSGELEAQILFPVKFSQKPLLSYAGELKEGDMLTSSRMPTLRMVVLSWILEDKPPFQSLYTGAVLGVVLDGPPGQRMLATWHMDGVAFSNPV